MDILGTPLGWIMKWLYELTTNYGLSIVLFTLITKVLLFPLAIKQQKGMVKMASFQPKLEALSKKYGNDKQKLQQAQMELYQKEGYSPLSGCLPMLIQLPILFGLINVIYRPLTHIFSFAEETITEAITIAETALGGLNNYAPELSVVEAFIKDPALFANVEGFDVTKLATFQVDLFGISGLSILAQPSFAFNMLLLIPIFSGLTSLLLSWFSQKMAVTGQSAGAGSAKTMMYMMPLISVFFSFQVPVGVGFYWVCQNVIGIAQTLIVNKMYNPREIAEKARQEQEEAEEKERQERIEAKKAIAAKRASKDTKNATDEENEEQKQKAMTQKEKDKQKLAEARRRDALKYGEEFVDVTDNDLK